MVSQRQPSLQRAVPPNSIHAVLAVSVSMVPVGVKHRASAASAGLLLWSILLIQQQQHILGSILFAVLVNMKHLYASLAPIYLVYLLRYYCRSALPAFPLAAQCCYPLWVTSVYRLPCLSIGYYAAWRMACRHHDSRLDKHAKHLLYKLMSRVVLFMLMVQNSL